MPFGPFAVAPVRACAVASGRDYSLLDPTYSSLEGGKSAPVGFARFPAMLASLCSTLLSIGLQHCVDDMLCVERKCTIETAYNSWMRLMRILGWDVPIRKSPPPTQIGKVVGGSLDPRNIPMGRPTIGITSKRLAALDKALRELMVSRHLTSGRASQLVGKMGFACSQVFGRYGRAKLGAFKRRCYERRSNWNRALERTTAWWISSLANYVKREVPLFPMVEKPVVSYSDGEGCSSGGFGTALWDPQLEAPVAGFMEIPEPVRRLWASQRSKQLPTEELSDIFYIEAIGPAMVMEQWPQRLQGRPWIHSIDNVGAQCCIVRGSSRAEAGDAVVNYTWGRVAHLRTFLWVDRVASKSNPVDGLSRGVFRGPWKSVERLRFPRALLEAIQEALSESEPLGH